MNPLRIALNRPLPPLTYLGPVGVPNGVRVRVKVRQGSALGLSLGADAHPPAVKLRPLDVVVDPFPLLPSPVRQLLSFAAGYYGCTEAHLLPLSLPQGLEPRWMEPLPDGRTLAELRDQGAWEALAQAGEAWHAGTLSLPTLFHRLERRGAGLTEVRRTEVPHPLKVTGSQAKLLLALENAGGALLEEDLLDIAEVGSSVLATLEKKGLLERFKRVDLLAQKRTATEVRQVTLSEEQKRAVDAVALGAFHPHLLYGVTGSGKTEVYLELVRRTLALGKRVLWLVPEIGLTPRLLSRLEGAFPGQVAVGHAGLNTSERQADVIRLLNDEPRIFVGVRNAVLAPLRRVGLIIVDEEHEGSYKSEEHPRIQARDLAIKRAQLENCPVVLGSATPSLESWHAAQEGRYKLLTLTQRPGTAVLPSVEIVDLREVYREQRKKVVFSPKLLEALGETLTRGEQSMLLLNRRGFENFWMCRACGKLLECAHCAISLTYHKGAWKLRCHLCGFEAAPPEACPHCGAEHLRGVGEGTEQVEEQLQTLFSTARILRLDRDTTSRRGSLEAGLLAAEEGHVDILVGTQMLAKGHTFPKLTLVGILNADMGLKVADFRASERTFQLLTQVAGRAGRKELPGRVLLQTYSPDHPAIECALKQDFLAFAASELPFREGLQYPPFAHLALYRSEHKDVAEAKDALEGLKAQLKQVPGLKLLGPLEAPVPRAKDLWRFQLLVKSPHRGPIGEAMARTSGTPTSGLSVDRDPQSFG